MYIQTFPDLHSFKSLSFKTLKKANNNMAEKSADFFLVRINAQWDKGSSRILLGERHLCHHSCFGERTLIFWDALSCLKSCFDQLLPVIVTGKCLSDKHCGGPAHKRKPVNLELKIKSFKMAKPRFLFSRIQLSFFKCGRKKHSWKIVNPWQTMWGV